MSPPASARAERIAPDVPMPPHVAPLGAARTAQRAVPTHRIAVALPLPGEIVAARSAGVRAVHCWPILGALSGFPSVNWALADALRPGHSRDGGRRRIDTMRIPATEKWSSSRYAPCAGRHWVGGTNQERAAMQ